MSAGRSWPRAILVRIGQVAFGLLLGLLLTEALLQVGSLFTWSLRGGQRTEPVGAGRRIVFLGDSNTFGLGAGFKNSYPQVLQRRWNHDVGQGKVSAVNLGTPGLNSSKLRQQLPGILMSLHPDVLTIMIGVNDLWTAPAPIEAAADDWHYRLWKYSRLYRLLYMLSRVPENSELNIGRKGSKAGPVISVTDDVQLVWTGRADPQTGIGKWNDTLQENLDSMIVDARQLGIETVLVTYPMDEGWYGAVNKLLRQTAARTHTPLIDVGAAFRAACPQGQCPELLLPDQHPTVRGQQLAADVIWDYFAAQGVASGAASAPTSVPAPTPTP